MMRWIAGMMLTIAAPALAGEPSPQAWTHAQSGIVIPATIGDMAKGEGRDAPGDALPIALPVLLGKAPGMGSVSFDGPKSP